MGRPSLTEEKRREFMPIVAKTFVELGYRRSTTAEIAKRCGVQENVLYRVWPNKKAMFLASIEYNYQVTVADWHDIIEKLGGNESPAEKILEHEAGHHGDWGLYRLVFAGLNEIDDPDILAGLQGLYTRFVQFIQDVFTKHRKINNLPVVKSTDARLFAWALIGVASAADIGRDLQLLDEKARRKLWQQVGGMILNG